MIPTFTYFAVDKGNMTLVQFTNGINMLVDCRASANRAAPLEYLKTKIKTLDFVVITHPHQDHMTGLKDVCEYFRPKHLWHNGRYFKPDPVYDDWSYYEDLRNGKLSYCTPVAVRAGQSASIGNTRLFIVAPRIPFLEGTPDDENNNGIILKVSVDSMGFVLTGDTQEEQWNTIGLDLLGKTKTFLASHHGRESGFSEKALKAMQPEIIIISDGEPNENDATEKYQDFAVVKTTRERNVVVQPKQV